MGTRYTIGQIYLVFKRLGYDRSPLVIRDLVRKLNSGSKSDSICETELPLVRSGLDINTHDDIVRDMFLT